ncbi:MAG: GGDEF domain-containing protein [Gemmatimonadales bacterium]
MGLGSSTPWGEPDVQDRSGQHTPHAPRWRPSPTPPADPHQEARLAPGLLTPEITASAHRPISSEETLTRISGRLARQTLADIGTEAVRILLIEDNPRHAQLMQDTMGDVGPAVSGSQPYQLTHVSGLADGLEQLKTREVDVVLLDLSLPEAPGLDALVRIRERHEDVPVIALTARGEDDLATQSLQAGAQDFLQKGKITGELLARAIRAAVHISNLQAALRSLSFIDGLTGLYNRRGFVTLAEPYIKRAQRQKGQFLVVSADVAGLKQINTEASYDAGDAVLRAVAEILKKSFRDSDLLARMDGGAFAVMAVDASTDKAPIIATRIQYNVQEWNNRTIRNYELRLNLGFTEFDPSGAIEDLIAKAADARRGPRRRSGGRKPRPS